MPQPPHRLRNDLKMCRVWDVKPCPTQPNLGNSASPCEYPVVLTWRPNEGTSTSRHRMFSATTGRRRRRQVRWSGTWKSVKRQWRTAYQNAFDGLFQAYLVPITPLLYRSHCRFWPNFYWPNTENHFPFRSPAVCEWCCDG